MRKYSIVVAGIFFVFLINGLCFGQLTDKQKSLEGIEAVYVFVQGANQDTRKATLDSETVKAAVEKRLRDFGIKVVASEKAGTVPGICAFYVNISAFRREQEPAFVYHVDVGILQPVTLMRDSDIKMLAVTWNSGRLGYCPVSKLENSIDETTSYLLGKFHTDYRSVNPE